MLDNIQLHIGNRLDPSHNSKRWIAGIIGDRPSQYAKSPILWNAAFSALEMDAVFLPFDVEAKNLPGLVQALRENDHVVGFSVTVPFKERIIEFLDELDPKAHQIGAVNTVARTRDGRLIGFNTDGQGFLNMLTRPPLGQHASFVNDLKGRSALLIGAGGAAKAVAFFLAEALGDQGRLTIVNRDATKASQLTASVAESYSNAVCAAESEIEAVAPAVDLIINATVKGQSGIRKISEGRATVLEPYSALGPANPALLSEELVSNESGFYARWYKESQRDIEANRVFANKVTMAVPATTAFVDLIYTPIESPMLVAARWSGHRTLNGKGMNIGQAADAFVNRVMTPHFASRGTDLNEIYRRVFAEMSHVW